jgi:hypothetical protein
MYRFKQRLYVSTLCDSLPQIFEKGRFAENSIIVLSVQRHCTSRQLQNEKGKEHNQGK